MTTQDFITELFCKVDDQMQELTKYSQANLCPSEVTTIGLLHAIKGIGNRAFYRWSDQNHRDLFPGLPHRTCLFRLLRRHQDWCDPFLAKPSLPGVVDCYGLELIHPIREGRSHQQIEKKGKSNHCWIVGGKRCLVLNHLGLVSAWDCATANVHDTSFQPLIQRFEDQMVIPGDMGFHARGEDPSNLKLCHRGEWNERMLVETVLSMLTLVCHFKKVMQPVWEYFRARLGFTMAAFNFLAQWNGLKPDEDGFVHLSIADSVSSPTSANS